MAPLRPKWSKIGGFESLLASQNLLDYLLQCAAVFLPQRVNVTELATVPSVGSAYTRTVFGLIGGTTYTVWMTSSTAQGDGGIQSDPQTVFLPEYGQSCMHTPTPIYTHTLSRK